MPAKKYNPQKMKINGHEWTHSGGVSRSKAKVKEFKKELKSWGLKVRTVPSLSQKGKFIVYVRGRSKKRL